MTGTLSQEAQEKEASHLTICSTLQVERRTVKSNANSKKPAFIGTHIQIREGAVAEKRKEGWGVTDVTALGSSVQQAAKWAAK